MRWPPRDGGLGARRTQNGPRDLNVVCEAKPAGDTWQNAVPEHALPGQRSVFTGWRSARELSDLAALTRNRPRGCGDTTDTGCPRLPSHGGPSASTPVTENPHGPQTEVAGNSGLRRSVTSPGAFSDLTLFSHCHRVRFSLQVLLSPEIPVCWLGCCLPPARMWASPSLAIVACSLLTAQPRAWHPGPVGAR